MLSETEFRKIVRRNPLRLINLAARYTHCEAGRTLEALGLTESLLAYLFALYWQDGQSQRELSEFTMQDPATTVRALDKMEKADLLERLPDPNDRRQWRIFLTEKSKSIQPETIKCFFGLQEKSFAGLEPEDVEHLTRCLLKIIENIGGTDGLKRITDNE